MNHATPTSRQRSTASLVALVAVIALVALPEAALSAPLGPPTPTPTPLPAAATPAATSADSDGPVVRRRFDGGLAALKERRFDDAAAAFDTVAGNARLAERRAAAVALGRYARRLQRAGLVGPPPEDPSAGRTQFIISSTLVGAYSGAVVLDLMDNDDVRVGAGVMLAATGAGFAASLYGSRGLRITEATGQAYSWGLIWGAASGALAAAGADADTSESIQLSTLAGIGLGGAAAFIAADAFNPTRGQVSFISNGSILGAGSALMLLMVLQPDDVDDQVLAWTVFGGLQLGTLAGVMIAPEVDWSLSRSRLTLLGAGLGALTSWGVYFLAVGDEIDSVRSMGATILVGAWAGYGLAAWLTEDMRPDPQYRPPGMQSMVVPTVMPGVAGNAAPGLAWVGRF